MHNHVINKRILGFAIAKLRKYSDKFRFFKKKWLKIANKNCRHFADILQTFYSKQFNHIENENNTLFIKTARPAGPRRDISAPHNRPFAAAPPALRCVRPPRMLEWRGDAERSSVSFQKAVFQINLFRC